ncbi:MAG TPA: S-methyl-5-thioribose-1-phosphate isomerase [Atribacteraceae bacterium]|nr:S-methyl-5-thioribose-1-phosphate isomerase [Atribacteraceae bacterium]
MLKPIYWKGDSLEYLDQTRLPLETIYRRTSDYRVIAGAIRSLAIRGAPLIGVSAAYGLCLGAMALLSSNERAFEGGLNEVDEVLRMTRPTAVNLFWALDRMRAVWSNRCHPPRDSHEIVARLVAEAQSIEEEDCRVNEAIARNGASLLYDGDTVLTHCNAGVLACSAWGTALGAITWAVLKEKKNIRVYADETRPLLQGARLTAFELFENGISATVICDNMAGYYMLEGVIDKAIVGADRIAANGDVANKIGTYTVAVLCRYHNIPFYVAAPLSTFDFTVESGAMIPIEQRDPREIVYWNGRRISPPGISVGNPAFDVTPGELITGIVTEKGIMTPPFSDAIQGLKFLRSELNGR